MLVRRSSQITVWVRPLAASVALLLLAGSGAACGGDESTPSTTVDQDETTSSTASGGTTTAAAGGTGGQARNDIQECEISDGTGTASGAIENQGDEAASFELTLGFIDDATGEELGRGTAQVDNVEPGGSGDWSITADGLADAEVTCATKGLDAKPAT